MTYLVIVGVVNGDRAKLDFRYVDALSGEDAASHAACIAANHGAKVASCIVVGGAAAIHVGPKDVVAAS